MDMNPPFFSADDDYVIAITGKAFSYILDQIETHNSEKYKKIFKVLLRKCVVYARMHPDEKALMIKHQ